MQPRTFNRLRGHKINQINYICIYINGGVLCDYLITRSELANPLCVSNCVCLGTSKVTRPRPKLDCCAKQEKCVFLPLMNLAVTMTFT